MMVIVSGFPVVLSTHSSYFLPPFSWRRGWERLGGQPAAGQVNPPPHALPGDGIKHPFQNSEPLKSNKNHSLNPSCLLAGGTVNISPSLSMQDQHTTLTMLKSNPSLESPLRFPSL